MIIKTVVPAARSVIRNYRARRGPDQHTIIACFESAEITLCFINAFNAARVHPNENVFASPNLPATELPTLPVPPASSPPFSSDMVAPPPEPPMRAKGKQKEVDEKDVVVTRRVPIKRTGSADNLIGQSLSKKARPTSTRSTRKSFT
ncbi:hypothetical protein C8J57DRAFT_1520891 [Mycena rebaudengoi]|nr:hypothetical protein C8J57DRAFT_1520891 [Mycena rebaudengoi]